MQKREKTIEEQSAANANRVREHYEKWPFPGISFEGREGLILLRYLREILNYGVPDKKRVIDIGCGTGHGTLALARHFPDVRFVGVDISTASLRQANRASEVSGLTNVAFRQGNLLDSRNLPRGTFDVILSFGVLHHIENARTAFANMSGLIGDGGTVILWLYGRYGRICHNLNQAFIDLISRNRKQNERERTAHEFISRLGERFALGSGFYTPHGSGIDGLGWLLDHREWLADQMIPAYEHAYTMEEVLTMFREHGIRFKKWLGVATRLESYTSSPLLRKEFDSLETEEQLVAIDHLVKPEYYFVSGRKETGQTDDYSRNKRI